MMKSEKGITLVALVVTIIVLLILAGITLMLAVSDNGILGRANEARVTQIEAEVKEQVELAFLSARMEVLKVLAVNPDASITTTQVEGWIDAALDGTGTDYTVSGGKVTYGAAAYKTATHVDGAKLQYTYTLSADNRTITNGTYSSNAGTISSLPATPTT